MIVNLVLKSCEKCPNMVQTRHYTADSFEMVFDWKCKSKNDKLIAIQDWNDKVAKIPEWCPLRVKEEKTILDIADELAAEVYALRRGVGVSYAKDSDPLLKLERFKNEN